MQPSRRRNPQHARVRQRRVLRRVGLSKSPAGGMKIPPPSGINHNATMTAIKRRRYEVKKSRKGRTRAPLS